MTNDDQRGKDLPISRRLWGRGALIGAVILLCGMVIGGGLTSFVVWRRVQNSVMNPRVMPARIVDHMRGPLDLTDEQAQQLHEIFTRHHSRFEELRKEMEPLVEEELEAIRTEVAAVLTPEQLEKWNRRFDRMRKRWFRGPMFGRKGPHGPPPHFSFEEHPDPLGQ